MSRLTTPRMLALVVPAVALVVAGFVIDVAAVRWVGGLVAVVTATWWLRRRVERRAAEATLEERRPDA